MAYGNTVSICLVIGGLLLIGLIIYYCLNKKPQKENYSYAGALDNLGAIETSYELIASPDDVVPSAHFADLVDDGNLPGVVQQPMNAGDAVRPLQRLERIQNRDLLPRTAASVTPYQVDVANMATWSFAVNAPRVQLKNRQWDQSDKIRGDIPITYHPDVALVGKSQFGRDSINLAGFFSDQFSSLYNKYTGRAYKNIPIKVAAQGTVMDYVA